MSGCDYLPSLPGMGVKKAHGLIKRFKTYQMVAILDLHTFD
jgi:exonuclease-1